MGPGPKLSVSGRGPCGPGPKGASSALGLGPCPWAWAHGPGPMSWPTESLTVSDSQILRISDSQILRTTTCRNVECLGARNGSPWLATGSRWVEMNRTASRKLFRHLPGSRTARDQENPRKKRKNLNILKIRTAGFGAGVGKRRICDQIEELIGGIGSKRNISEESGHPWPPG